MIARMGLAFVSRASIIGTGPAPRLGTVRDFRAFRRVKGNGMSDNPNILVIWGDDIGISNLSCYSDGVMGYRTRNIDRIAAKGRGSPTITGSRAAPLGVRP